ncbi:hypothetical protein JK361_26155 [Streptomyces sp. 5-8]|uniref:Uncharacterized protein n=1 Tax=Streptomyces musisoli TaxID=2802280 RepID=A0ABS1P785_9ACTN|nr:hypothetical protein [Streptomyces musisoli]MBL1108030.1 hypothetical protein [Streptomyces musisoli]
MSEPIKDIEAAVRSLGALPMPMGDALQLPPDERAKLAKQLGDARPARNSLLVVLGESVENRREHAHPTWEDLYCLNLTSYMGERMAPVLRRLLDAEAQVTDLVAQRERRRDRLVKAEADLLEMRGLLSPNGERRRIPDEVEIYERVAPAVAWLLTRVAELEAAPTFVYRAEHPDSGITLGHYGTAKAARAHCEATERRSWPTATTLAFDWIEDEEDGVAELVVVAGQNEESTTGYIVTALELASEYDAEADE